MNNPRDAFELKYATEWRKATNMKESAEELAALIKTWREGDTYGLDIPRIRFGWEGYQMALPDAARFRWLTEDHENPAERERCREILGRMPVMSYSSACSDIDAAMSRRDKC